MLKRREGGNQLARTSSAYLGPCSAAKCDAVRGRAGTVLVIDDDPAARDLMKRFLSREGFQAVVADSGEEGDGILRVGLARGTRPRCGDRRLLVDPVGGQALGDVDGSYT